MKRHLSILLSILMTVTTGQSAFADQSGDPAAGGQCSAPPKDGQCYTPIANECWKHGAAAAVGVQAGAAGLTNSHINQQGNGVQGVTSTGAANFGAQAQKCAQVKNRCKEECGPKKVGHSQAKIKISECNQEFDRLIQCAQITAVDLNNQANQAGQVADRSGTDPQSSNPTGSSGGMGALGAAALGALGGFMLAKMLDKDKDKPPMMPLPTPGTTADGALQPNGTIDCSKADAYKYSDCDQYLGTVCSQKMGANTYDTDKLCQDFSKRFCGGSSSAAVQPVADNKTVDLGDGAVAQSNTPPLGAKGEGLTSNPAFCQAVLAHNYCKKAGRNGCPSCLQIAANQAPACKDNPALCLAQNSPAQLEEAKKSCPTDPIFANPDAIKTGGQVATELQPGANLPVVQLPSGATASASTNSSTASANANTGGVVVSTMSVKPGSGSGTREGVGPGVGSQAAYGGGSASGSNGYAGAGGNSREVASASGAGYKPASANAGPAPDVQGQFGPSVFAVGTQVLRQRCQAGKLNNCP